MNRRQFVVSLVCGGLLAETGSKAAEFRPRGSQKKFIANIAQQVAGLSGNRPPKFDALFLLREVGGDRCPYRYYIQQPYIVTSSHTVLTDIDHGCWGADPAKLWVFADSGLTSLGNETGILSSWVRAGNIEPGFPLTKGAQGMMNGMPAVVLAVVQTIEQFAWLPGPFSIVVYGTREAPNLGAQATIWSHLLQFAINNMGGEAVVGAVAGGRQFGESQAALQRLINDSPSARQRLEHEKRMNEALGGMLGSLVR